MIEEFLRDPAEAFASDIPSAYSISGDVHLRFWRTQEALLNFRKAMTASESLEISEDNPGWYSAQRAIQLLIKMGDNGSGYSEKKRSYCYGLFRFCF